MNGLGPQQCLKDAFLLGRVGAVDSDRHRPPDLHLYEISAASGDGLSANAVGYQSERELPWGELPTISGGAMADALVLFSHAAELSERRKRRKTPAHYYARVPDVWSMFGCSPPASRHSGLRH